MPTIQHPMPTIQADCVSHGLTVLQGAPASGAGSTGRGGPATSTKQPTPQQPSINRNGSSDVARKITYDDQQTQRQKIFGWVVMSPIIVWAILQVYINIYEIAINRAFTAFDCARLANDLCGTTINLLVVLLWHSFTMKSDRVHRFWRWKTWFLPDGLMPGGFAPRPAAFSVGILLFVSGSLVRERVVTGTQMMHSLDWSGGMQCRANSVDILHADSVWFGRFRRGFPLGCYYGGDDPNSTHNIIPQMFTKEEIDRLNATGNITWVEHPRVETTSATDIPFLTSALKHANITWIGTPELHLPMRDATWSGALNPDIVCMYQCVSWENWGVNLVVHKLGVILSGALVVVKATDSLSAFVGHRLVTADTSASQLERLFRRTSAFDSTWYVRRFGKSSAYCAFQMGFIRGVMAWFAPRFDRDGFYTVDYYVTTVLVISVLTAVMLRIWNPYLLSPIIYTRHLWSEGADTFFSVQADEDGTVKNRRMKVDLYEWIHMAPIDRMRLLIIYSRRVSSDPSNFEACPVINLRTFNVEKSHEETIQIDRGGRLVPRRVVWKRRLTIEEGAKGEALRLTNGLVTVRWERDFNVIIEEDLAGDDMRRFVLEAGPDAYDTDVDPLNVAEQSTEQDNWDDLEHKWLGKEHVLESTMSHLPSRHTSDMAKPLLTP